MCKLSETSVKAITVAFMGDESGEVAEKIFFRTLFWFETAVLGFDRPYT
jgi:1,4-alpha-glucan branching enzyme